MTINVSVGAVAAAVICVATTSVVVTLACVTYNTGDQFMADGKAYGFNKRYEDLSKLFHAKEIELRGRLDQLVNANTEISRLTALNNKLEQENADRTRRERSVWYPGDSATFFTSGDYASSTKQGHGTWKSLRSEISLKFLSIDGSGSEFETNLASPADRVRFKGSKETLVFYADKYEYLITADNWAANNVVYVNIDRRDRR